MAKMTDVSQVEFETVYRIVRRIDIQSASFKGIDFKKIWLFNAIFKNCRFENCDFFDVDLKQAAFTDCKLKGCRFDGANLCNASMNRNQISNCTFRECLMFGFQSDDSFKKREV